MAEINATTENEMALTCWKKICKLCLNMVKYEWNQYCAKEIEPITKFRYQSEDIEIKKVNDLA